MDFKIAVLPGDGIGPEVIEQAVKTMNAVGKKFNHSFNYEYALVGAAAIDKTGSPLPDETLIKCKASDAVLFGAIGDPKYDNDPSARVRPEQGLLAMRSELGLYANVRPVTTFPSLLDRSPLKREILDGVDILMVRELTGGIYFGKPQGRSEDGKTAYDSCVYSKFEIERVVRLACEYALKRKGKVTVVDKANVLATSRLWRETSKEIVHDYPGIEMDFLFVDNAAMQLIQNPGRFDVIVTENMFGDILSDEASVITGSLGLLPSASIGSSTSVFEPVHGSYPQAAGKNIANPLGTILSAAMLLETGLNLTGESEALKRAVEKSLEAGMVTEDLDRSNPCSTNMVGDWISEYILHN
ncbi:MAG: 3-isopropylmalate dehydrogenase [Bacteroidales bacterium]|nr:3-isopropylmalate dehydrogenase [Bacteroidales bacterium]MDT8373761.1 3-isopropylmalate dehydrogenase [Bacteroidales bacterium]